VDEFEDRVGQAIVERRPSRVSRWQLPESDGTAEFENPPPFLVGQVAEGSSAAKLVPMKVGVGDTSPEAELEEHIQALEAGSLEKGVEGGRGLWDLHVLIPVSLVII
jgi:hypothetical protein